ncbi:MAG TPA: FtsX-like permease family protein [Bacteroidota bacterium]|nr:FtsX-like permease family protein [Bacteroidota bacterium]
MTPVEYFIARRYLLSKRRVRFINVIGYISITGITVGVAALIIVLAVFNGFRDVVTDVLVGFDPHVRIEKKGSFASDDAEKVIGIAKNLPEVTGIAPFIEGKAMLVAKSYNNVVFIRGVQGKTIGTVSGLKDKIMFGNADLSDSSGVGDIVLGLGLADRLATVVGDEIQIISPAGFQSTFQGFGVPQTMKFRVAGIYNSDNKEYDASYAYISITAAQRLFDMPNRYSGIEMRLNDFRTSENVKSKLSEILPRDLTISTWYDLHSTLYAVMKVERWTAYVLLCLIILVATFNMLGSLSMAVIEKKRDIGVLKSMGMPNKGIIDIFMLEGLLIGTVGTILGFVLGLVVIYLQYHYHLFALDTNVYIIPAIPVKIDWMDFLYIAIASMGLTWLAAYYPARKAARTNEAEALRWE